MKLKQTLNSTFIIGLFCTFFACGSNVNTNKISSDSNASTENLANKPAQKVRVMFYNTENLFDIVDDPKNTGDDGYLPKSKYDWTLERYNKKLNDLAKVIQTAETPDLIGLGEVENTKVVEDLAAAIGQKNWGIIHQDSPDERGIDVAMIYNKDEFVVDKWEAINVQLPETTDDKGKVQKDLTRDILMISGQLKKQEVVVFVNHWPSRRNPDAARVAAATEVAKRTQKILEKNKNANIIIMGDLNDEPNNISLAQTLKAQNPTNKIDNSALYNLGFPAFENNLGSYNYNGDINLLDHIIVSGNMLQNNSKMQTKVSDFTIFQADFMIFEHPKYGKMANRTYGSKYFGGISDHFPVYTDLYLR